MKSWGGEEKKKIYIPDDLIKGKEEIMKYSDLDTFKNKNKNLKAGITKKRKKRH